MNLADFIAASERDRLRAEELRLALMADLFDPTRKSNEVGGIITRGLATARATLERFANQQAGSDGSGVAPRTDGGNPPGPAGVAGTTTTSEPEGARPS